MARVIIQYNLPDFKTRKGELVLYSAGPVDDGQEADDLISDLENYSGAVNITAIPADGEGFGD